MTILPVDEHERDAVLKELRRRLSVPGREDRMGHGQIARAARFVVQELGYDWILPRAETNRTKSVLLYFCIRLEVRKAVRGWHRDAGSVWSAFKVHSLQAASRKEALKVIARARRADGL